MTFLKNMFTRKQNNQTTGLIQEANARIDYWSSLSKMSDAELMDAIRQQTLTSETIANQYATIDKQLFIRLMRKNKDLYDKYHTKIFDIYTPLQRRMYALQSQFLQPHLMEGKMINLSIRAKQNMEQTQRNKAKIANLQRRLNTLRGTVRVGGMRKKHSFKTRRHR